MQIATAMRDLMGTPLQTLELSLSVLKKRHPEERALLDRMRRSLQRLAELRPVSGPEALARLRTLREIGARLEQLSAAEPNDIGPSSEAAGDRTKDGELLAEGGARRTT
jgi:hypothetical protein